MSLPISPRDFDLTMEQEFALACYDQYSTFYFYEVHLKVFNSLLEKGFGRIKRCNQV